MHTLADFNAKVLGTKFILCQRRDQSRIMLLVGKVLVSFDDQQHPNVILKLGELLETREVQLT